MSNPLIKICGIKHPEIARQAAQMGADFIGLVFHPGSRRNVPIEQAKIISQAAKAEKAIPVGIFVNHSAKEMEDIAQATQIECLQLHGAKARQQHHLLPQKYQRIYVQTVTENGIINNDDDDGLRYCDPSRDFLLFDNLQPGIGQPFAWNSFIYTGAFRMGLAGGLTAQNITTAINQIQPVLVDTSSGVENQFGDKDPDLIQKFIHSVQATPSLRALAKQSSERIVPALDCFANARNDELTKQETL